MEAMTKRSCEQYLTDLAGKAPVPGGGGTAALVGALGVALGNMVGNLTTGKKKYAAVEEDIRALNRRSEELRRELEGLVTADAEVFEPLSRAYALPKTTPEEQAHREEVMAQVLEQACAVPMEIMEGCAQAIELVEEYARKGSVMAVSDAGCAAALCRAAMEAASLNVFINTKSMTDRARAAELNA
jgi:formiminotetrahydrofolate cyclodeaminase